MPIQTGVVLNQRYRIVRLLGQGGFGAVYRAWDLRLSLPVAVKENLDVSLEAQKQFEREARILANLNHPNLPRVTDHFVIEGQGQYLVMDFVEGDDLQKYLEQGAQPEAQAVDWISQICEALTYLHSQNPPIIHRDIKPANIRITPAGVAKLVDFGIAKVYVPHMKTTLGARAVTPGFSPAEQYGQGKTDARTDLYALGATLYSLLTGEQPVESVQRIVDDPLVPPDQLIPGLRPQTAQAVMRSLQMDPASRFQSAAEFKAALAEPATPLVAYHTPVAVSHPVTGGMPAAAGPAVPASTPHPGGAAPPAGISTPVQPESRVSQLHQPEAVAQKQVQPGKRSSTLVVGAVLAVICLSVIVFLLLRADGRGKESPTDTALPVAVGPADTLLAPEPTEPQPTRLLPPTEPPASPTPEFRSRDPQTLTITGWTDPQALDPAYSYDSKGVAILMNVYDTLVFFDKENPSVFVAQLAEEVPTLENGGISADGIQITFKIRRGVKFHDGSLLTPEDVAYTFQRGLLQGGGASPQFLLVEPLLGIEYYDVTELVGDGSAAYDPEALAKMNAAELVRVCNLVKSKIVADNNAWTVRFNLEQPWAPLMATLARSWGSVQSRDWVIGHGGWDGDCTSWQKYYGKDAAALLKLGIGTEAMGTGPYILDHWTLGEEIILKANESYWRSEPAWMGGPVGAPAIKTVIFKNVTDFGDSFAMLQAGEADMIEANNSNWIELNNLTGQVCNQSDQDCQPSSQPDQPLEMVRGFSQSSLYGVFMNWDINTEGGNAYIGSGQLDGKGIPADFFSNIHVRRAFAYCFDVDALIKQAYLGEAEQKDRLLLPEMPGFEKVDLQYRYNQSACENEFRLAVIHGKSVWDTGFYLVSAYNPGHIIRKVFGEILKKGLATVNSRFVVEVKEIPSTELTTDTRNRKMPLFFGGWIDDIHDPYNLVVPFTLGIYSLRQGLPENLRSQFKELIYQGAQQYNPDIRADTYRKLDQLYHEQLPFVFLVQPADRYYQQRWVHGRFSNMILSGVYLYSLYKD